MKQSPLISISGNACAVRPLFQGVFSVLLAGFIVVSLSLAGRAQPSRYEAEGEEVLTRGPVHEAFAAVVSYNPEPGLIVRTRPPELIEELPPEERPEGEDVAWIPGYWGWDDERNDHLWISGTWRILPPGREWLAGYWRESVDGYQWISGYWADSNERETTYLPPPPVTLEVGANLDAPSADYGWTPGYWDWREDRYAWRAGYWAEGRADWVWSPSYYVWTPRGYIFVEGFWDYPVERRGILFAPVYYRSHAYSRRGYSYSPRIAINLALFLDNLFLRPRYHHYYFGDYYGPRYEQDGFYASISFQSSRRGYDPFYSHNRWTHRSDRDWDNRFQASYRYRRDNEAARPPRTWSAQVSLTTSTPVSGSVRLQLAAPLELLARSPGTTIQLQTVARDDRQKLAQRGREVQQTREQRRAVEARAAIAPGRPAGVAVEPARVTAPRSPIAARRPKAEAPGRPHNADRRNAGSDTRPPEAGRNVPADRRAAAPRGQEAQASPAPAQTDTEQRNREIEAKSRLAERAQAQTEERRNAAADKTRDESQRKAQQDDERRNRDTEAKNQAEAKSRQKATEAAAGNKQQAEERRQAAADKARDEAERQAQQDAGQRNRDREEKQQAGDKSRQKANEAAAGNKQQAEERRQAGEAKAREESQEKTRRDDDRRNRDAEAKFQAAEKNQAQAEERERANEPAGKARDEAPRKEPPAPARVQPDDERRGRDAAAQVKPPAKGKSAEEEADEAKKEKENSRRR